MRIQKPFGPLLRLPENVVSNLCFFDWFDLKKIIVHCMDTEVPLKNRHCLNLWIWVNTSEMHELHFGYTIINISNTDHYIQGQKAIQEQNNPVSYIVCCNWTVGVLCWDKREDMVEVVWHLLNDPEKRDHILRPTIREHS